MSAHHGEGILSNTKTMCKSVAPLKTVKYLVLWVAVPHSYQGIPSTVHYKLLHQFQWPK